MKFPMYSIRDVKSYTFQSPMVSTNDFTMQRAIAEQLINERNDIMAFSPKDFDLYRIGTFDVEKGETISESPIVLIANCKEIVENYGYKKE